MVGRVGAALQLLLLALLLGLKVVGGGTFGFLLQDVPLLFVDFAALAQVGLSLRRG